MSLIVTTMGPWKTPAGLQEILVINIGTFLFSSMWRIGIFDWSKASSKEKLQSKRKVTKLPDLLLAWPSFPFG
jgi:hypothetical protein